MLDNTNKPLLYDFDEILMSKTGYTNAAGWNVALIVEKYAQRFSVIVLGATTKDQRLEITRELITTYFDQLAQANLDTKTVTLWDRVKDWLRFY